MEAHLLKIFHGIAKRSVDTLGDDFKGLIVNLNFFTYNDPFERTHKFLGRCFGEDKRHTAGFYRHRHFLRIGRCKDEHCVGRRFLERLQERIKRFGREHVHLIDNVNFVRAGRWRQINPIPEGPHLVNAAVTGSIDFNNIQIPSLRNGNAGFAFAARPGFRGLFTVK